MDTTDFETMSDAVGRAYGPHVKFLESVTVDAKLPDHFEWDGQVYVFEIQRPPLDRCFAWLLKEFPQRHVSVTRVHNVPGTVEIDTAQKAISAALAHGFPEVPGASNGR